MTARIPADTISGDMPPRLFKYMSLGSSGNSEEMIHRIEQLLRMHKIYLPSPNMFNDPFDSLPCMSVDIAETRRLAFAKAHVKKYHRRESRAFRRGRVKMIKGELLSAQRNPDKDNVLLLTAHETNKIVGIYSLAEDPLHLLMWSHYAGSHTGICLEFDTSFPPFSLARKVQYKDERPVVKVLSAAHAEQLAESKLQKAKVWSYEQEWRIVVPGHVGFLDFNPRALKSLTFGPFTDFGVRKRIGAVAAHMPAGFRLRHAYLDRSTYELHWGEGDAPGGLDSIGTNEKQTPPSRR